MTGQGAPCAGTEGLVEFVAAIRDALGTTVTEDWAGTAGGYTWTWVHRGIWVLRCGGVLEPGVDLSGPAGRWRCPPASLLAADVVLILLGLAGAMPPAKSAVGGATYRG